MTGARKVVEQDFSGRLADYQFGFLNGEVQVTDTRPSPSDGTYRLHAVEQIVFGDGTRAYILGAGSQNPADLLIEMVSGSNPLVVLGHAIKHYIWSGIG